MDMPLGRPKITSQFCPSQSALQLVPQYQGHGHSGEIADAASIIFCSMLQLRFLLFRMQCHTLQFLASSALISLP